MTAILDVASVLDDDPDTAIGDAAEYLEGASLSYYPEPEQHEHRCPACGQDWLHRDEECSTDGTVSPWTGALRSGYATCGDCAKPGASGAAL